MKIIVSSTQYPYYGGAATNAYNIIKELRLRGHRVLGLFFENSAAHCDPDKIGGILKVGNNTSKSTVRSVVSKYLKGRVDVILAKNYAAPNLCRNIFPKNKIIYLVSGSPLMIPLSESKISASRYLKLSDSEFKKLYGRNHHFGPEVQAIKNSDSIICNSQISLNVFRKTYSGLFGDKLSFEPVDTSSMGMPAKRSLNNKVRSFSSRNIDIAFICSNFKRGVKNADLAKKLFLSKKLRGKKKLAVGMGHDMFRGIPLTTARGLLAHKNVVSYLSRTKLVICTSYFDASPNILREASMMGCNILLSENCGWSEKYSRHNVCKDAYDIREWESKADYLCSKRVPVVNLKIKSPVVLLENLILEVITR
jgi:glycosyltransferase involved in cell wall biosynthesis